MDLSTIAPIVLVALAAAGVAYVFLYPLLSGEARAEKRQQALLGAPTDRRAERVTGLSRRDQVAQSLKEVETREKAKAGSKVTIETRIAQAGLAWTKRRFFVVSGIAGLAVGFLGLIVVGNPLAALGGAFVGGLGLPRWILSSMRKRRTARFIAELPNALDVVVRGIRSGLPLHDCIRMIASEAREPLRTEFRTVVEAQTLGISLGDALTKLYERVPVQEANFVAIVIGIQQKSGGNLSEAIGNLSRVLRDRKKMRDKVQAMSMEAKSSGAIIAALPVVVGTITYLTSPNYISMLWTTQSGQIVMVGAGIWMAIGVFVMKGMINFDI